MNGRSITVTFGFGIGLVHNITEELIRRPFEKLAQRRWKPKQSSTLDRQDSDYRSPAIGLVRSGRERIYGGLMTSDP